MCPKKLILAYTQHDRSRCQDQGACPRAPCTMISFIPTVPKSNLLAAESNVSMHDSSSSQRRLLIDLRCCCCRCTPVNVHRPSSTCIPPLQRRPICDIQEVKHRCKNDCPDTVTYKLLPPYETTHEVPVKFHVNLIHRSEDIAVWIFRIFGLKCIFRSPKLGFWGTLDR